MRILTIALLAVLLLTLAGCGKSNDQSPEDFAKNLLAGQPGQPGQVGAVPPGAEDEDETTMKEAVAATKEVADVLAQIRDEASARSLAARYRSAEKRHKDIEPRFLALKSRIDRDRQLRQRLWDKYGQAYNNEQRNLRQQFDRVQAIPNAIVGLRTGAGADVAAGGAETDEDRIALEAINAFNEFAGALGTIQDVDSARAAVALARPVAARKQELEARIKQMRGRGTRHQQALLEASQRVVSEVTRVQGIPGAWEALVEGLAASGDDSPRQPFAGKPPAVPPGFGRRPNMPGNFPSFDADKAQYIARFGLEKIAILQIKNVEGLDVHETLAAAFKRLVDDEHPNHGMFTSGNLTQAVVAPVSDLKAFAGKIAFGKVTNIDEAGRTIEVEADRSKFPVAKAAEPFPDRPSRPTKPADVADAVAGALEDLKSTDRHRRAWALRQLAELKPNERRAEVAKALEALLDDNDGFIRKDAVKGLEVWGTKENVPALLKQLTHNDSFFRGDVIELLGKMKDERAVEPVAARLTEFFDRGNASKALHDMGPMAEKTLHRYLSHPDGGVRHEACKILKGIGTRASAQILQQAARQTRDRGLAQLASEALFDIANREAIAKASGEKPADPKKPATAEKPAVAVKPDEGEPDADKLGKELPNAAAARQLDIIRKLQETKGPEFTQALTDAIPKLSGATQTKAREALADRLTRMRATTLKSYLEGDNAELRRAAATACGSKGVKELVPDLIALLTKEDGEVAQAAHDALKALTGQRIDLAKGASLTDRKVAAERWNAWWQANGSKP